MSLSLDDIFAFRSVSDVQLSPDGRRFAFVVGDNYTTLLDVDNGQPARVSRSSIWVCLTSPEATPYQLTHSPRSDSLPRWSPDSKILAFLSDRAMVGQRQIYTIAVDNLDLEKPNATDDKANALTDIVGDIPSPRGLNAVQWDPDGNSILFLLEERAESTERDFGDDALEFEEHPAFVRVHRVHLQTKAVAVVSPRSAGQIWEFSPGPDGQVAAVVSAAPFEWSWYACRLVSFVGSDGNECQSATIRELASPTSDGGGKSPPQSRQVAQPQWSPDGKRIAFVASTWSDRGCVAGTLMVCNADGSGGMIELTPGIVASFGWSAWEHDGKTLLCIGHERGGSGLHRVSADGSGVTEQLWWEQSAVAEGNWPRFSSAVATELGKPPALAIIKQSSTQPRDVWVSNCWDGQAVISWRQATMMNPQSASISLPPVAMVHWNSVDGWEMQGLYYPPVKLADVAVNGRRSSDSSSEAEKPPTLMYVHGGPIGVSADNYVAGSPGGPCSIGLLQQAGYAVFCPNYRGSVGWGVEFAEANWEDCGGKDWLDMCAGLDHLVATGIADENRLGVLGWSYGGFTTAWAVSQTNRFKCAIMGAGYGDWSQFHGKAALCGEPGRWIPGVQFVDPYSKLTSSPTVSQSPLTYAKDICTPTLLLHGEEDVDVPVECGYAFFRALKTRGVPTHLSVYPREPHGVSEKEHLVDMTKKTLQWLKCWLPVGQAQQIIAKL